MSIVTIMTAAPMTVVDTIAVSVPAPAHVVGEQKVVVDTDVTAPVPVPVGGDS